jgi:hypothetical protein
LLDNGANETGIYLNQLLDCLVIKMLHKFLEEDRISAYGSDYGIFVEEQDLFPVSGFKAKSHAQIAIRIPECIVDYLRDPDFS